MKDKLQGARRGEIETTKGEVAISEARDGGDLGMNQIAGRKDDSWVVDLRN